jgi:hypothetical protein
MSEPKPRGRTPIGDREHQARVNVVVAPQQYDQAYAAARRDGISIPEVLRRGLARYLKADDDDE